MSSYEKLRERIKTIKEAIRKAESFQTALKAMTGYQSVVSEKASATILDGLNSDLKSAQADLLDLMEEQDIFLPHPAPNEDFKVCGRWKLPAKPGVVQFESFSFPKNPPRNTLIHLDYLEIMITLVPHQPLKAPNLYHIYWRHTRTHSFVLHHKCSLSGSSIFTEDVVDILDELTTSRGLIHAHQAMIDQARKNGRIS